jgi:hypothetical protein
MSSGPAYKHDVRSERTVVHDFGPGHASLEPVFVPRSGATNEDGAIVWFADCNRDALSYGFRAGVRGDERLSTCHYPECKFHR